MSGTQRVTLKPGDLIYWVPGDDEEGVAPSVAAVSDDGDKLLFQFGRVSWDQYPQAGPTVAEAVEILNGRAELQLSGRIYKAYDAERDRGLVDPHLLEDGEDL